MVMSGLSTRSRGLSSVRRRATESARPRLDVDNFFRAARNTTTPLRCNTQPQPIPEPPDTPRTLAKMDSDSKTQIMRQVQTEAAMQNARMLVEVPPPAPIAPVPGPLQHAR